MFELLTTLEHIDNHVVIRYQYENMILNIQWQIEIPELPAKFKDKEIKITKINYAKTFIADLDLQQSGEMPVEALKKMVKDKLKEWGN